MQASQMSGNALTPEVDFQTTDGESTQLFIEEAGDKVKISVNFESEQNQKMKTWVLIGEKSREFHELIEVTIDANKQNKRATFKLNTWTIGRGEDPSNGYSVIDTSPDTDGLKTSIGVVSDEPGSIDEPIPAGSYALRAMTSPDVPVSDDGTAFEPTDVTDSSTLQLAERSLQDESIDVYLAPANDSNMTDVDDSGDPLDTPNEITSNGVLVSEVGEVNASVPVGDHVVFGIESSGMDGYVSDVTDLLGPNGVHFYVAQQNTAVSQQPYYWDLTEGATLVKDAANDTYYIVVDTGNVNGVGTRDNDGLSSIPSEYSQFKGNLVIAGGNVDSGTIGDESTTKADFYENGNFPNDDNWEETFSTDTMGDLDFEWNPYLSESGQETAETKLNLTTVADRQVETETATETPSETGTATPTETATATPTPMPTATATVGSTPTSTPSTATPADEDLTTQAGDNEQRTTQQRNEDDGSGIPVLERFNSSGPSVALGLVVLMGGVGGYLVYRQTTTSEDEEENVPDG